METSFKTCMFGGFDREDVIAFIQKTAEENQTRLDALMAENEQLLTDKQAAEQQNRELTDRLAELESGWTMSPRCATGCESCRRSWKPCGGRTTPCGSRRPSTSP